MYKMRLFIMCLLSVLFILSCSTDEPYEVDLTDLVYVNIPSYTESDDKPLPSYSLEKNRFNYLDDCLYFHQAYPNSPSLMEYDGFRFSALLRLNIKTGNVTIVCPDPLCQHNTPECPFAGSMHAFALSGTTFIYSRSYKFTDLSRRKGNTYDSYSRFEICSYELDTMKFTVHSSRDDSSQSAVYITKMLYHNRNVYYDDIVFDKEKGEYRKQLICLNLDTNKAEPIGNPLNDLYSTNYLFIHNDRIYFTDGKTIFSTDMEMNNKVTHATGKFVFDAIKTDGEYIYYGIEENEDNSDETLYRVSLNGGEPENLGIVSIGGWRVTEKYIYYYKPARRYVYDPNGNRVTSILYDHLSRCDLDGKNSEIAIDFTDVAQKMNVSSLSAANLIIIGNYAYADYVSVLDNNGNGVFDEGDTRYVSNNDNNKNILRIDLTTGEVIKLNIPDV